MNILVRKILMLQLIILCTKNRTQTKLCNV